MIYVCYVLFALGMVSYVIAIFNIGSDRGETFSDVANGLMLLTTVLLLFRAARWGRKS
jgi:hypothetical protein